MHPIVVICLVLLALGIVIAVRWGHLEFRPPPPAEDPTFADQAKRVLWYLDVMIIGGVVSGLLVSGAGGRLAMRLLAVTAGDDAQGAVTEADEIVGKITVDGTLGFMIFGGLFAGLVTAMIYLALRKWLPSGRLGALALAALLLVTLATRADPLRSKNPDFQIVGPDWVAVLTFVALAVLHALVLFAVMARISHALPLVDASPRAAVAYLPILLLFPTALFGVLVVLVMLIGAYFSTNPRTRRAWANPRVLIFGRALIGVVALVSLPAFIASIAGILQSG